MKRLNKIKYVKYILIKFLIILINLSYSQEIILNEKDSLVIASIINKYKNNTDTFPLIIHHAFKGIKLKYFEVKNLQEHIAIYDVSPFDLNSHAPYIFTILLYNFNKNQHVILSYIEGQERIHVFIDRLYKVLNKQIKDNKKKYEAYHLLVKRFLEPF